jgi:hypothetical protein
MPHGPTLPFLERLVYIPFLHSMHNDTKNNIIFKKLNYCCILRIYFLFDNLITMAQTIQNSTIFLFFLLEANMHFNRVILCIIFLASANTHFTKKTLSRKNRTRSNRYGSDPALLLKIIKLISLFLGHFVQDMCMVSYAK